MNDPLLKTFYAHGSRRRLGATVAKPVYPCYARAQLDCWEGRYATATREQRFMHNAGLGNQKRHKRNSRQALSDAFDSPKVIKGPSKKDVREFVSDLF